MTAFSAMTWNVENLFRPEAGATEDERRSYEGKLGLLAGVIGRLDPDAVALQEVGGDGPLEDLQEALDGSYPHRAVSAFPDARGIRVAFLSRHPIEEREDVVEFPEGPALDVHDLTADGGTEPVDRMGRGALRVRVAKGDLSVDLISCHLKSKLLSFPRPWGTSFAPRDEGERAQVAGIALRRRAAEAVTLRLWVNALLEGGSGTPLIVLGDLNDVPEAQTSLILNGPPGSEIGTLGFGRPDEGDDARLFNLAPLIPQERRFSRIERGRAELLDQILASVECFPAGEDGKRRLPEADGHVDFRERLPSVTGDPGEREDDVAPDHAPVMATFDFVAPRGVMERGSVQEGTLRVILDPSLLLDAEAFGRARERWGVLTESGADVFVPAAFAALLRNYLDGEVDDETVARFIGFYVGADTEWTSLEELGQELGIYGGDGLAVAFFPEADEARRHEGFYDALREELEAADQAVPYLAQAILEEWVFLQERSWGVSHTAAAFNFMGRAGAVVVQAGRRGIERIARNTLNKNAQDELETTDKLVALGKWVVYAATTGVAAGAGAATGAGIGAVVLGSVVGNMVGQAVFMIDP